MAVGEAVSLSLYMPQEQPAETYRRELLNVAHSNQEICPVVEQRERVSFDLVDYSCV